MQISETRKDGLSREYSVTVPAATISERVDARLRKLGATARIPGFRPGKTPLAVLRQRYGDSATGEVLETLAQEALPAVLERDGLRPAMQPEVSLESYERGADMVLKLSIECAPDIPETDFAAIKLTRHRPVVSDADLDGALADLLERFPKFEPVKRARKSRSGDLLVVDFEGTSEGKEFPGNKAENFQIELGAGRVIPGFEDNLTGVKPGETVTFDLTFPEDYAEASLAGKPAQFTVTLRELQEKKKDRPADDDFAKELGLEGLDALKDILRGQLQETGAEVSRNLVKRALLDALHAAHDFETPARMVDMEFDTLWAQVEKSLKEGTLDQEDAGKDEDTLRGEYRAIAARRVMLALLLGDIGRRHELKVSEAEVRAQLVKRMGGDSPRLRQLMSDPKTASYMMESVRGPLFEDKVVDFILEMAQVEDVEISLDELKRLESGAAETAGA